RSVLKNFVGALRRVFPAAISDSQAIAFCMFVAFFPMLLFGFGLLALSSQMGGAAEQFFSDLRYFMPQQSRLAVTDFLTERGAGAAPRAWILLGLAGTLLGGSQVMSAFMQAFRNLFSDPAPAQYWRDQLRALLLLLVTGGPLLAAIILTVFSRQLRTWMILHFGLPALFNAVWVVVYVGLSLVIAVLVLSLLYHVGRCNDCTWNDILPGAVVSTLLWWVANSALGVYMTRVPYGVVYGGLAAAIGLLVWMNLCALIVLLGAAYNAEALSRRVRGS
ncbi:MAG: YihY/virulence factor BrkB family protein, partial [Acidobacteria bacterium]|nr:YihY/virulence factor BrkB family protein [Acidobacteriota bacterium]